jgi:dephospho-CoA kinase
MQNKVIIAITGGIACGKSQFANYLGNLGASIIEADTIVHGLMRPGLDCYNDILKAFGQDFLKPNKEIDRVALGKLVFNDSQKRKILEDIIHPRVQNQLDVEIEKFKGDNNNQKFLFYVIPLLFEVRNRTDKFREVITLSSSRSICIERIINRDKCDLTLARAKMASQLPLHIKEQKADRVVYNDGTSNDLKEQAEQLFKLLNYSYN